MAGEERADTYSRLNYYNGLFLKAADFEVEQAFHRITKQYINYLLFNPGRLYHTPFGVPEVSPLQIEEVVSATVPTVRITHGAALIRDEAQKRAYEVHLSESVDHQYNLADYISDSGSPTDVHIWVDWDEEDSEAVGEDIGGPAGVQVSPTPNRWTEQAVIHFIDVPSGPSEPVPPTETSILLGTVTNVNIAGNSIGSISNTSERGGIRYEILSTDLLRRIGTSSGDAVLTGITITPGAEDSILSEGNKSLTATGSYSDGSSDVLSSSTPGLVWESSDEDVATVNSDGVVTGGDQGSVTITVTVDTVSASVDLSVFTHVSITIEGELSMSIGESQNLTAMGEFDSGIVRELTHDGDGLEWESDAPAVATVNEENGEVSALTAGPAQITANVFGSSSASETITVASSILAPVFRTTGEEFLPTTVLLSDSPTIEIFCEHFFEGDPELRMIAIGGIPLTDDEMAGIVQTSDGIGRVPMPATLSEGRHHIVLTNEGGSTQSAGTLYVRNL